MWPQPLTPVGSLQLSAAVAAIPIAILLILMGVFRMSALHAAFWSLLSACAIALFVWRMPLHLAILSFAFGAVYATWPILWIILAALWLYHLSVETGSFEQLRRWILKNASNDPCIQALLVAFCFGALLESCAGFGAPVAITAFLLTELGFERKKAMIVALLANTAPVGFGAMGIPIVALAGVTDLPVQKLSAMVGRQLPLLSFVLPFYLVWLTDRRDGLKRVWPAALAVGSSYALTQFTISNFSGPYSADIVSALAAIGTLLLLLQLRRSGGIQERTSALNAWLPWMILAIVMLLWSSLGLFDRGQINFAVPLLHKAILISLYGKAYSAIYAFQPLSIGTAIAAATLLSALFLKAAPSNLAQCASKAIRQIAMPAFTIITIVGLAYLYNYSGMVYTLGAATARLGRAFAFLSGYLGWLGCFLTGSDAASNLLFGNLQVAAAHQLHLPPVLLAAANSSGGVVGKIISPQNIVVGVSTIGLIGQEGKIVRAAFWHSILLVSLLCALAFLQAYVFTWMVP